MSPPPKAPRPSRASHCGVQKFAQKRQHAKISAFAAFGTLMLNMLSVAALSSPESVPSDTTALDAQLSLQELPLHHFQPTKFRSTHNHHLLLSQKHKRAHPQVAATASKETDGALFNEGLAFAASASSSAGSSNSTSEWSLEDPSKRDPTWTFPQPFDTALGTSFSSDTCPSFFTNFLQSDDFRNCHPLSLLLTTSSGMFAAEQNATDVLPYVLEQTCQVDVDQCKATMSQLADQMQQKKVCGKDLDDDNQAAQTALNGFLSYPMMLEAGCLKNKKSGHYCMAEAAASTDSTAMYWWFLGAGETMPKDTPAKCNTCTNELMNIYSNYSTDADLSISKTYAAAAAVENAGCSSHFSLKVDAVSAVSAADRSLNPLSLSVVALLVSLATLCCMQA